MPCSCAWQMPTLHQSQSPGLRKTSFLSVLCTVAVCLLTPPSMQARAALHSYTFLANFCDIFSYPSLHHFLSYIRSEKIFSFPPECLVHCPTQWRWRTTSWWWRRWTMLSTPLSYVKSRISRAPAGTRSPPLSLVSLFNQPTYMQTRRHVQSTWIAPRTDDKCTHACTQT